MKKRNERGAPLAASWKCASFTIEEEEEERNVWKSGGFSILNDILHRFYILRLRFSLTNQNISRALIEWPELGLSES